MLVPAAEEPAAEALVAQALAAEVEVTAGPATEAGQVKGQVRLD